MSSTIEFCIARAAEADRAASDTSLDNVRETSERSRDAWLSMAERIRFFDERKERKLREKATQQEME